MGSGAWAGLEGCGAALQRGGARAVALCAGPLGISSPSPVLSLQTPPRAHALGGAPSTAPSPRAPCVLSAGIGGHPEGGWGPGLLPTPQQRQGTDLGR